MSKCLEGAALAGAWSLVSWNTAHRVGKLSAQVAALAGLAPDVIALQEVTKGTLPLLRDALASAGFSFIVDSVGVGKGPRQYGCLMASSYPLEQCRQLPVPWPEKVCSALVQLPSGSVEIHTAHVPPGSTNGWAKIEVLEGIYQGLGRPSPHARVLCGDFNCPRAELNDGTVVTWAQCERQDGTVRLRKRIRGADGARWDAGERNVLTGLGCHGMRDVYRALHGYGDEAYSFQLARRDMVVRRRFDHIFASQELAAVECGYLLEWRESGLSDHAPIFARMLSPKRGG